VFEDSRGLLWVGTDRVLCLFNKVSESFTKVQFSDGEDILRSLGPFISITEDSNGLLYVATMNDIFIISKELISKITNNTNHYITVDALGIDIINPKATEPTWNDNTEILDIEFDYQGNLWAILDHNIGIISPDGNHQVIWDGASNHGSQPSPATHFVIPNTSNGSDRGSPILSR
jgi:hypothetical protein